MTTVKVAAVQAAYTLMDRQACVEKAVDLLHKAAAAGAGIVVFPEAFIPGTPIWIDSRPDLGRRRRVVRDARRPGRRGARPGHRALGAAARDTGTYVVIGVEEREPHGSTIYNTTLYFGPDGSLLGKHRKLMPTGSERTVWGMGDGSTLPVIDTPYGRLSGLTCWENYMPLARFYLYSQGVDIWVAPTLAQGDGWVAAMRHIAQEGRCYVIGVNPCLHVDQIPADFPHRDRVWPRRPRRRQWVEPGNSVIVGPDRRGPGRAGAARGDDPVRRPRPRPRCAPPGASSTRSATTTGPTSSSSASTPGPGLRWSIGSARPTQKPPHEWSVRYRGCGAASPGGPGRTR